MGATGQADTQRPQSICINYAEVQQYLVKKRLKLTSTGFRYLITALQVIAAQPGKIHNMSDIYKIIAVLHNAKPAGVERAIGYTLRHLSATNKEFIYQAADDLIYSKEFYEFKKYIS